MNIFICIKNKTIVYYHSLLMSTILLLLVATGCKKADHSCLIPANANVVASINFVQLSQKSDRKKSTIVNMALSYLSSNLKDKDAKAKIMELQEHPENLGVDFRKPVFVFSMPSEIYGVTMSLYDDDKFEDVLSLLEKQKFAKTLPKSDELDFAKLFGEVTLAYNDDVVLLLYSKGKSNSYMKQACKDLFKLLPEDTFIASSDYEKMSKLPDDIAIYCNLSVLPDEFKSQSRTVLPTNIRFSDLKAISSLNFADGEMKLCSELYTDNEATQMALDSSEDLLVNIGSAHIKEVPDGALITLFAGVRGQKLYEYVSRVEELKRMMAFVNVISDISIKDIMNATNGDVEYCLSNDMKTTSIRVEQEGKDDFVYQFGKMDMGSGTKLEKWFDDMSKCVLFAHVDLNLFDKNQYTRSIPFKSVRDAIDSLDCLTLEMHHWSDAEIVLHSKNNQNLLEQLMK